MPCWPASTATLACLASTTRTARITHPSTCVLPASHALCWALGVVALLSHTHAHACVVLLPCYRTHWLVHMPRIACTSLAPCTSLVPTHHASHSHPSLHLSHTHQPCTPRTCATRIASQAYARKGLACVLGDAAKYPCTSTRQCLALLWLCLVRGTHTHMHASA